jgi:hypothetical protein
LEDEEALSVGGASGGRSQIKVGVDDVVRQEELSAVVPFDETPFQQHGDVLMQTLDVPAKRSAKPAQGAGAERLKAFDEVPAFGRQHAEQLRGR